MRLSRTQQAIAGIVAAFLALALIAYFATPPSVTLPDGTVITQSDIDDANRRTGSTWTLDDFRDLGQGAPTPSAEPEPAPAATPTPTATPTATKRSRSAQEYELDAVLVTAADLNAADPLLAKVEADPQAESDLNRADPPKWATCDAIGPRPDYTVSLESKFAAFVEWLPDYPVGVSVQVSDQLTNVGSDRIMAWTSKLATSCPTFDGGTRMALDPSPDHPKFVQYSTLYDDGGSAVVTVAQQGKYLVIVKQDQPGTNTAGAYSETVAAAQLAKLPR